MIHFCGSPNNIRVGGRDSQSRMADTIFMWRRAAAHKGGVWNRNHQNAEKYSYKGKWKIIYWKHFKPKHDRIFVWYESALKHFGNWKAYVVGGSAVVFAMVAMGVLGVVLRWHIVLIFCVQAISHFSYIVCAQTLWRLPCSLIAICPVCGIIYRADSK